MAQGTDNIYTMPVFGRVASLMHMALDYAGVDGYQGSFRAVHLPTKCLAVLPSRFCYEPCMLLQDQSTIDKCLDQSSP